MRTTASPSKLSKPVSLLLVAGLLAVLVPAGVTATPGVQANYIIGYADASGSAVLAAAGITPLREHAGLGLAAVLIPDATAATLATNPHISFVEPNKLAVFAAATGWDATGWTASDMDATGWTATGWTATGWTATGWDSTEASATGWDATGWTATGWDATGWDATGWTATGWDATGWTATGWTATGWDATGWTATGWTSQELTDRGATTTPGADPLYARQWGLRAVFGHDALHNATAPATHSICIVDSGIDYTHPDLAAAMWRDPVTNAVGYDFVNNDSDPMDDAGHGTHVAGIAAAVGKNGIGILGASREKVMAVKVLSATGSGYEADLAWGIAWCADHGASVISMSLGTPEDSKAVQRAINDAHAKGATIVASIGNSGRCSACTHYPAAYPNVIAVGATTPTGSPAAFSTVSSHVDLAAPGAAIVSLLPGARYAAMNGTSQAAPFVAAAAALMRDANPNLTPGQVAAILAATAHDVGPAGKDAYVGAGILDMRAALAAAS